MEAFLLGYIQAKSVWDYEFVVKFARGFRAGPPVETVFFFRPSSLEPWFFNHMLGQGDIVKYFDQCEDALAVEEVFSAYITW